MPGILLTWLGRIRGGSGESYISIPAEQVPPMPGSFHDNIQTPDRTPNATPVATPPARANDPLTSLYAASTSDGIIAKFLNFVIVKPVLFLLILMFRILASLIGIIYFKPSPSTLFFNNTDTVETRSKQDPISRAHRFVCDLEDLTPPQQLDCGHNLPPFFQGSYAQALLMASSRAKFLFVYLTTIDNENAAPLFHKVVINPEFVSIFHENSNIIIWGGDLTNPEAFQLANSLSVTKYPFLGLLCLTRPNSITGQGSSRATPRISLILKIAGDVPDDVDVSELIDTKFKQKIAKHSVDLALIRNELREKYTREALRQQQERQYQASASKDRAKTRQKEYEKLRKQFLVYNAERFSKLEHEPQSDPSKIAIKLFDGSRISVVFPGDAPVRDIFIYVVLKDEGYLSNTNLSSSLSDAEATALFAGFEVKFDFTLTSPLPPRKVLNAYFDSRIREIDSIYPNGLLIAEKMLE